MASACSELEILESSALDAMRQLNRAVRFRLIYCDPPFYSGKLQAAEKSAFEDRWPSFDAYLEFMQAHIQAMAERLEPAGFLALHCDWHASHYLKVMGDRIFGYENFRNEIVWHYKGRRQPAIIRLNSKHDVILVWARSKAARMNALADPYDRDHYVAMKRKAVQVDEDGREWIWGHMGKGRPRAYKIYIDEAVRRGRPLDDVWDIPIINIMAKERVGYPTQKPLALLTRLVELLTEPGDLVGDFMAGSGTTGEAALRLGRRAILADANPDAVRIMKKRLKNVTVNLAAF